MKQAQPCEDLVHNQGRVWASHAPDAPAGGMQESPKLVAWKGPAGSQWHHKLDQVVQRVRQHEVHGNSRFLEVQHMMVYNVAEDTLQLGGWSFRRVWPSLLM